MPEAAKPVRYNPGPVTLMFPAPGTESSEAADLDVALMRRIHARDASAVGELYDRHKRLLYGLILRVVGQRGEAEELLQEVFFTVWHEAATYNQALGSPVGWMVGIARHRALDHLRSRAVRATPREAVAEPEPAESPTPAPSSRTTA